MTLDEPATLSGSLHRGTHLVRSLHARLKAGAASVALPARLRRGRYVVRVRLTDAAGNRTRSLVATFRVR
jgi:hypothetical protein